jgi:glucose-6-phosphate dehydrogenase assembly protein OpcA
VIITLTGTTAGEIERSILRARSNVGVPTGLVFSMIAVAEACDHDEVVAACVAAGREHPSRILVVSSADPDGEARLDAEIRLGEEVPGDIIALRLHGELTRHAESVLLALLLPDSPVVVWWPGLAPDSPGDDPVGALAVRRITDAMGTPEPIPALLARACSYSPGDTDLTWTRLTRWRGLLAAATDAYRWPVTAAEVRGEPDNAAALLLAAWLDCRLEVPVTLVDDTSGPGITGVVLHTEQGDLRLERGDGSLAGFSAPGLSRRIVALPRRDLNALITEELRRLEEDAAYSATMARLALRNSSAPDRGCEDER